MKWEIPDHIKSIAAKKNPTDEEGEQKNIFYFPLTILQKKQVL